MNEKVIQTNSQNWNHHGDNNDNNDDGSNSSFPLQSADGNCLLNKTLIYVIQMASRPFGTG